jgi:hypothetical protein
MPYTRSNVDIKPRMPPYGIIICTASSTLTPCSLTVSFLNNSMAHFFINDQGYMKLTPMSLKSQASHGLNELIQDVRIPRHIHSDGAKEQTLGHWKKTCKEHYIATSNTEPNSPWQNCADSGIHNLKCNVTYQYTQTSMGFLCYTCH